MLHIKNLLDDEKCYATIRNMRWPEGVCCAHCGSKEVHKRGKDEKQRARQRYHCKECDRDFDDLTNTIFAGHHQPLETWILSLYFMGLNVSNQQIAQELSIDKNDSQNMATLLRSGIEVRREPITLSGEVECDEVYIAAGHKGNSSAVKKKS